MQGVIDRVGELMGAWIGVQGDQSEEDALEGSLIGDPMGVDGEDRMGRLDG